MKKTYLKPLFIIACLIAVTCAALAFSDKIKAETPSIAPPASPQPAPAKSGILTLSGHLVQDKIFTGGDGSASLELTLHADDVLKKEEKNIRHADMVIVLDRSGSMQGRKISDARQAALKLLENLSSQDRFALVTYSSDVRMDSPLVPVTESAREHLVSVISRIHADGGTNLGGGLQEGIRVLTQTAKTGNPGRLILISDGLANEGITDPAALGNMASIAVEKEFVLSTVGVGNDFNEQLMTAIADRGTGNYYYMETPESFANVFLNEFHSARTAVATSLEIRIPLSKGVTLADAAGYPVQIKDNTAVFYPGDLRSGQIRKIFLTFRIPVHEENSFEISQITAKYLHMGQPGTVTLAEPFRITCVNDQKAAFSSIRKDAWEKKVVQDEYSQLKQDVARDMKEGNAPAAMQKIDEYEVRQQAANAVVKSEAVTENLDKDVNELRTTVQQTFTGSREEVAEKQKSNAKALQFEGYQGRRK
ncbi:MAG: VWA domain-containing protein [Desulfococcaceae bacterium]